MLQKIINALMPANKMINMFTFKIESNKRISEVIAKIPLSCEENKFALFKHMFIMKQLKARGFQ